MRTKVELETIVGVLAQNRKKVKTSLPLRSSVRGCIPSNGSEIADRYILALLLSGQTFKSMEKFFGFAGINSVL